MFRGCLLLRTRIHAVEPPFKTRCPSQKRDNSLLNLILEEVIFVEDT